MWQSVCTQSISHNSFKLDDILDAANHVHTKLNLVPVWRVLKYFTWLGWEDKPTLCFEFYSGQITVEKVARRIKPKRLVLLVVLGFLRKLRFGTGCRITAHSQL